MFITVCIILFLTADFSLVRGDDVPDLGGCGAIHIRAHKHVGQAQALALQQSTLHLHHQLDVQVFAGWILYRLWGQKNGLAGAIDVWSMSNQKLFFVLLFFLVTLTTMVFATPVSLRSFRVETGLVGCSTPYTKRDTTCI